jgi:hypothetical protein
VVPCPRPDDGPRRPTSAPCPRSPQRDTTARPRRCGGSWSAWDSRAPCTKVRGRRSSTP